MPKARLEAWMSAQSACDVDSRGWSRSPKGRSNASSASVAAPVEPTKSRIKIHPVSLGTAISALIYSLPLTNRAKSFLQEKELAETKTVCKSCT
jgi:hypothetical protein